MAKRNDLSQSLAAFDQDSTLVAVTETSQSRWLVDAIVGVVSRVVQRLGFGVVNLSAEFVV